MPELNEEELKAAVKDALREWLDEKYSQFGKWTLHGLLAMAVAGLTWVTLVSQGWHK